MESLKIVTGKTEKERKQLMEKASIEQQAKAFHILSHFIEFCIKFRCAYIIDTRRWQWLKYAVLTGKLSEDNVMEEARELKYLARVYEERKLKGSR